MKYIIVITLFTLLLTGCSSPEPTYDWTGFYYPDKNSINDESTWVIQPGFSSLEDCQKWLLFDISGDNTNFDYECGYKCRYDETYKMNICKETTK